MTVTEWNRRCIDYFKSGNATDDQWDELAEIMLVASEGNSLDITIGTDKAIDPRYDEVAQ